jgi:hypothetical protein
MSIKPNYVQLPRTIDTDVLAQRKSESQDRCLNGFYKETQFGGYYVHPAADEVVSYNNVDQFLAKVGEMAVKGILLYPHVQPVITGSLFQLCYYKPQDQIDALLLLAEQEAESAYKLEIEDHNNNQIALLTSQMLATGQRKEDKKQQDLQDSAHAKALAEATAFIQSQLKEV